MDVFSIGLKQVIQQHPGGRDWAETVERCGAVGRIESQIAWSVGPTILTGGSRGSLDSNLWGYDQNVPHAEPPPPSDWEFRNGVIAQGNLAAALEWNSCIWPPTGSLRVSSSIAVQPGGPDRRGKRPQEGHLVQWERALR